MCDGNLVMHGEPAAQRQAALTGALYAGRTAAAV